MIPKKIIHLLSGGLDSVTMLHKHVHDGHLVHCVLVDYGQQHVKELGFAQRHAEMLGVQFTKLTIPRLGGLSEDNWNVPARNAILVSIACNIAIRSGSESVTIGCNRDDSEMFHDCRPEFIKSVSAACLSAYGVEICAPFISLRKSEIADLARQMGVRDVWWCYRGEEMPCGKCPSCRKMKVHT